ncbi:hypothetical protein V8B97DRAFT_2025289 [Scleroderma yunnanense]
MPQPILASFLLVLSFHAGYIATYTPQDAPYQTQSEQSGYNSCGTGYNQTSECQNVYVNSVQDFCLWAPPYPGSTVGDTERVEVAWCMQSGYGTRLIPDGTITGAHLVVTPDYIQITGVGNLTNLNILATDLGGELDYYGAAGAGYPVGGLVFSNAFGQLAQIPEWTSFISYNLFCIRACNPSSSANLCQYAYPTMGCEWNMPASYSGGVFEHCVGDSAEPVGIYGTSTFSPGQPMTPSPQSIPPSSSCTFYSTISNGQSLRPSDVTSTDSKISSSHTSQTSTSLSSFTQSSSSFAPTSSSQPASSGGSLSQSQTLTSLLTSSTLGPSSSTSSTPFQCPPGYLMAKPSTNGSASFKVSFGGWRPLVLIALTILLGLWC